jgi:coenzyme Q-binding protein COQ10
LSTVYTLVGALSRLYLPKFVFEKIIKSDRNKVFETSTNYANFQKILPQYFPSIRVISIRGNISVVEEHLIMGGHELVMMVKHVINEPILHEIFVIGGDAKGTHITKRFECIPQGTKMIIDVDWKLKRMTRIIYFRRKINLLKEYSKIIDAFTVIVEN